EGGLDRPLGRRCGLRMEPSSRTTGISTPYMTQLANAYSLAQRWTGLVDPSEGDYVALAAGSTFNITATARPSRIRTSRRSRTSSPDDHQLSSKHSGERQGARLRVASQFDGPEKTKAESN